LRSPAISGPAGVDDLSLMGDWSIEGTGMPFKSQAQRRKFAQLLVAGKITPETFEEWNRETGAKRLPERIRAKTKKTSPAKGAKHRASSRAKKR
jgi:hypothetical protein